MEPLIPMQACAEAQWPLRATQEMATAIAAAGEALHLECGQRLFSLGDPADGIFLLRQGAVRTWLPAEAGRELATRIATTGAVLGLPAALCSHSYQLHAEAAEDVEAIHLPTERLQHLLREQPQLCMKVMGMMCDELSVLRQTQEHLRHCNNSGCSLHGACSQSGA